MSQDQNKKVRLKKSFFRLHDGYLIFFLFLYPLLRSYLILGNDDEGPSNALGIGDNSIVIEWRDEWYRRLRKYQRQAHTCD